MISVFSILKHPFPEKFSGTIPPKMLVSHTDCESIILIKCIWKKQKANINLLASKHESYDSSYKVRVHKGLSISNIFDTGLRQGSILSPLLSILV